MIDQCVSVSVFAVLAMLFAATVRETYEDSALRWAARGIGAVGVGVLVAFCWRISVENESLQNQIARKAVTNASGIALSDGGNAGRDLLSNASLTTRSGHVVSVSNRPMPTGIGRLGRAWDGVRYMDGGLQGATPGEAGSLLVLPGGVSAASGHESSLSEF